jgi:hypothetical protein
MKVKAPENAVKATAVLDSSVNVIPMEEKEDSACHVFCYAALADKHTGTMYTDATGALPVVTLEGHQYYFVAYAYDPNNIFAIAMRNVKDESILEAFDRVFQELKEKGFKPEFNVTDNQATQPIKEYLKKENTEWQFVEPHNHHVIMKGINGYMSQSSSLIFVMRVVENSAHHVPFSGHNPGHQLTKHPNHSF